jgi:tetratricopeptide (TPR) repeat protein
MRHKASVVLACGLIALAVSACAGGPSEADIEATVEAKLAEDQAAEATVEARARVVAKAMVEPTAQAAPTATPSPHPTQTPPLTSEDYFERGNDYHDRGDHGKAIEQYNEAIRLHPEYVSALINRGATYADLGHYERAIQNFDVAIRLAPEHSTALYNRSAAYAALGDYALADFGQINWVTYPQIDEYDRVIQDNERGSAYCKAGVDSYNRGHYDTALGYIDQALRSNPMYAECWYARGLTYEKLGKPKEAARDYTRAKNLGYEPP